jgi:dihydropteroate synthase
MTPEFWRIIDRTRPDRSDPGAHAAALAWALAESGTEATLRFAAAFDAAIDALYTWDLWGAAYLSFGGCSVTPGSFPSSTLTPMRAISR